MISFGTYLFNLNLGRWRKASHLKISNNEVSTHESLTLDSTFMHVRTFLLDNFFLKIEQKVSVLMCNPPTQSEARSNFPAHHFSTHGVRQKKMTPLLSLVN